MLSVMLPASPPREYEFIRQRAVRVLHLQRHTLTRAYVLACLFANQHRPWLLIIVRGLLPLAIHEYLRPVVKPAANDDQLLAAHRSAGDLEIGSYLGDEDVRTTTTVNRLKRTC